MNHLPHQVLVRHMIKFTSPHNALVACFCATFSFTTPALAAENLFADGLFSVDPERDLTYADVGVAAITRDTYVGSGESDAFVLPFVSAEYKGRFYIKPALGAGMYIINKPNLRLTSGATLALGRDSESVPILGRAGKLSTSVVTNMSARYVLPFAAVDVLGQLPVSGDMNGARVDVFMTTSITPIEGFRITPGVRASYQSAGWLNSLYGVSNAQSLASGVSPFNLDGQFSTLGAHAAAYLTVTENWEVVGAVNYSRLMKDVTDSPLVNSRNGLTAALGLARKF